MSEVFVTDAHRDHIHRELGTPVRAVTYPTPRPASRVAMFPVVFDINDPLISGHDDFVYTGRVKDPLTEAAMGMTLGMLGAPTLGLVELYLFPTSVVSAFRESRRTHQFRVWYQGDVYLMHVSIHDEHAPTE